MEWMIELTTEFKLCMYTTHISVFLFDLVLQNVKVKKSQLQVRPATPRCRARAPAREERAQRTGGRELGDSGTDGAAGREGRRGGRGGGKHIERA